MRCSFCCKDTRFKWQQCKCKWTCEVNTCILMWLLFFSYLPLHVWLISTCEWRECCSDDKTLAKTPSPLGAVCTPGKRQNVWRNDQRQTPELLFRGHCKQQRLTSKHLILVLRLCRFLSSTLSSNTPTRLVKCQENLVQIYILCKANAEI